MPTLHSPLQAGELALPNRIIMAPLTRVRAGTTHIPNELMATYYSQRASSGLILTECSMVDAHGCAFIGEGGIYSPEHVAGWRRVTEAVHARGGRIMQQIWHPGRAAHSALNGGEPPVCSSAKAIRNSMTKTLDGPQPYEVPQALSLEAIPRYVEMFRQAAEYAKAAGFDGVQIHGAHGYLIDTFLRDGVNQRSDSYGGSIENRARFLLQVTDAAITVWGRGRVAVRISPLVPFNDMEDSDPEALLAYVAEQLQARQIAFLEIRHDDQARPRERAILASARKHFHGALLTNGSYGPDSGNQIIESGAADAVVYGRLYIANPDLVERFARHAPLQEPNPETFYGGGEAGYTDYPFLSQKQAR